MLTMIVYFVYFKYFSVSQFIQPLSRTAVIPEYIITIRYDS